MSGPLTGLIEKQTLRRWRKASAAVGEMDVSALKTLRTKARALGRHVDQVLHVAEGRLALPVAGQAAIRKPLQSDWAWRPELWCGPIKPVGVALVETETKIGREAKVFHDCGLNEVSFRQLRNHRSEDVAAYGVRFDVFQFGGSFLSLVLDMPHEATDGLGKGHLIRLDVRVETERPIAIFGRVNVRHGPNVEQIVRAFDGSNGAFSIEFDLSTTRIHEARVDRAWVDLIFEAPEMNEIVVRDVTMSRRPRAAL